MSKKETLEYTFTGKGTSVDTAIKDLYASAEQQASKEGRELPRDFRDQPVQYAVAVQLDKKGRFFWGEQNHRYEEAFTSALLAAGVEQWPQELDRHNLQVRAKGTYQLENKVTKKGQPSGAAPSIRVKGDITELF
ncbi:hypothetical protein HYX13_03435 [Candidatus Woesearchaeota archaeon]|nr:hypothetical protein [Candidatus Woesearchaeota archaeon]